MRLEARGLKKEIGGRELYRELDLRVEQGCTLAIRGPSGAGKSQLLRHLAGLDPNRSATIVQAGSISLNGRDYEQWDPFEWRSQVCSVPQQVPRLQGAPAELEDRIAKLSVQRDRKSDDPRELAVSFGLSTELWERPWTELSIGEGHRALLAILLARCPAVILLDEPTAALDPDATAAVEERLKGATCVWITHSSDQAGRVGDEILTLSGETDAD